MPNIGMFTHAGASARSGFQSRGSRAGFARGCAYPALTVLREFNDRAGMFLNRLVARVGLEPTTSAL